MVSGIIAGPARHIESILDHFEYDLMVLQIVVILFMFCFLEL